MGKWADGQIQNVNVKVKDKLGDAVVHESVKEIILPTDENGVNQSYFDMMRLNAYYCKLVDGKYVVIDFIHVLARFLGNYGQIVGVAATYIDENGYGDDGDKQIEIVITNKTLTKGNSYSAEYLLNNRG